MQLNTVASRHFGVIWDTFFIYVLGMPNEMDSESQNYYSQYFKMSAKLLPCKKCRDYFVNVLMTKYPIDLTSRERAFASVYIWKSIVNKKLGKPNDSFKKVIDYYNSFIV